MIITVNNNPIRIIGYPESSMTQEFVNEIEQTHAVEVMLPKDFLNNQSIDYQYIVAVSVDFDERRKIIDIIDTKNLDLITVIHNTSIIGLNPPAQVMPGTFIFPFCNVMIGSYVGRHCIICPYTSIGHYCYLGNSCITRPGVIVSGKSTVGNHCLLGVRSTVTNAVSIADNVEILGFTNVVKNIDSAGRYGGSATRKIPVLNYN
jgi:UDP-3-O-[3-hydroxymyristoyl] glucosamine N-acyltransferase